MPDLNELRPRKYQEEIFRRAQKENIIAALDTGAGKTYISLMLIRWIASLDSSKNKVVVFLVPKVALVQQQGDFITQNSPFEVLKLSGELDIDLSERNKWIERIERTNVIVLTAQIFLDLLLHSNWSMERVSLMVFDECHHAKGRHPFNMIMTEYFQTSKDVRPKIFGLTASPIWNFKRPEEALATLEKNMDATLIAVIEHARELETHAPRPSQLIKVYHPAPAEYPVPFTPIWSWLQHFDGVDMSEGDFNWEKLRTRYHVTCEGLGVFGASLYLYLEVQPRVINLISSFSKFPELTLLDGQDSLLSRQESYSDLIIMHDLMSQYENLFDDTSDVSLEWCSPKLRCLVDLLQEYYTPSFQSIVFVEQRQTTICLAKVLSRMAVLKGKISCGAMVGSQNSGDHVSRSISMDAVERFKRREHNLLIATAVAEEGLDFPACDLVVRFDPFNNLVAYLQSRGRVRNKSSTFVSMFREDDVESIARYETFIASEPSLRTAYQSRRVPTTNVQHHQPIYEEDDDEEVLADCSEDERFVVPSTGAVLTYGNAIPLLAHLCGLLPRDTFTSYPRPEYTGELTSTLRLPVGLPLAAADRVFVGPVKPTKKQARRAVAFAAVKRLYELSVFDDYLLPAASRKKTHMDAEGRPFTWKLADIPAIMEVHVCTPFVMDNVAYCHPVFVDGIRAAGLVISTPLFPCRFRRRGKSVTISNPTQMHLSPEQSSLMSEFTVLNIFHHNSGRPLPGRPSVYLVPIQPSDTGKGYLPDINSIILFLQHPFGNPDWSRLISESHLLQGCLLVNRNEHGRVYSLRNIRHDLQIGSTPSPDTAEAGHKTYREYFTERWTRKGKTDWTPRVPDDGPLLEVWRYLKSDDGRYSLNGHDELPIDTVSFGGLLPQGYTGWLDLPAVVSTAYANFPAMIDRITHTYRARRAKVELNLPDIDEDLLIEALTLPMAGMKYSNQRLETLGDAVLELCTTVHLFNKYPHRHEGQLTIMRAASVSNRCLLCRAKEIGLEKYLICERPSVADWPHIDDGQVYHPNSSQLQRVRKVVFPRRSLQDCIEASLGASFLTGGIDMALRTGTAFALTFGGKSPWIFRYPRPPRSVTPLLAESLQDKLRYDFHQGHLLVEALTHPSFSESAGSSYQRLEFLGDAVINLVAVEYLYRKFPDATSFQLSMPRARVVCSPALASLAVRRLELHKILLINNAELSASIQKSVSIFQETSPVDVINRGWCLDPPKALSDAFESVVGALFVDTSFNYDKVAAIVEFLMEDLLEVLSPSLPLDPISELKQFIAKAGCRKHVDWRNSPPKREGLPPGLALYHHDTPITRPITTTNLAVARKLAADRALPILKGLAESEKSLASICDCKSRKQNDSAVSSTDNPPILDS